MISMAENTGGRPATRPAPAGGMELILDETKYKLVAVLIPSRLNHIGPIEVAYALGGGVFSDCKRLAAIWACWAVLCDPAWAEEQLKKNAPRPHGPKCFFMK